MATITTCITNQAKMDFFMGGNVIAVSNAQTGNVIATNNIINQLTNTAPLTVGMWVNCTNQNTVSGAPTYVTQIVNSTAVYVSTFPTAAAQQTITFRGDTLFMALISFTFARSYDRNTKCLANLQVATSDEASGTGYTANGVQLTIAAPGVGFAADIIDSNTAILNFSPNPSWTSATLNVEGCMIYNWGQGNVAGACRQGWTASGASANSGTVGLSTAGANVGQHAISLHDFGGQQTVTGGTLTVNMPTANGTAAILRIA